MNLPRFHRHEDDAPHTPAEVAESHVVQVSVDELADVFSAPRWLRDLGFASWLLVGVAALLFGMVWLLGATAVITQPVIVAFVVASVASPLVSWLGRHRVPRAGGAAIVLLALVAVGALVLLLVIGGIVSQSDEVGAHAGEAADKVQGWLEDAGVDSSGASSATDSVKQDTPEVISTFVGGLVNGITEITSLALGLSFAALSLFFLLKDGPSLRAGVEQRMGVPKPVARTITGNVIRSLRGYFAGVTIVAAFNGVVVGLGAWVLGVPLAGTIAVVAFVTAYIPYIGAFVTGAFAVLLALGSEGPRTAAIMLVIVLLGNGLLQNILQPIAFGATLGLNPLVVLIVTIGAGALFGMVGLVLAAPLTSAAVHISTDLARAKAAAAATVPGAAEPEGAPG
ncbi:MAG: AI-2E family transporter [Gaiellaceae bacterium]